MINNKKYLLQCFYLLLIILALFISCGKRDVAENIDEKILARVSDKSISVNEFIRRAEYTIRPPYCSDENYIHRKIVLNSLIAEKLLALEAGENNELTRNEQFQDYILGRQEQAMRQWLYHEVAYKKVKLDTNEIKKIYQLAGRTYKLEYCSVEDSAIASLIQKEVLQGNGSFEDACRKHLGIIEIPKREISWNKRNDDLIQDVLFSEPLKKNQLVGPVQTDEGYHLLMKVSGWTDRVVFTDTDVQNRWNDVTENLTEKHAIQIYEDYIASVMKGKKVQFARDTFFKLAEIVAPYYLKTEQDKKEAFNKRFWKDEIVPGAIGGNIEQILDHSLLQIDGQTWTVAKLVKELKSHPLVFRKRKMKTSEFPEQLKLAIVDLIRDKYLTQQAYDKGYDKIGIVKRNTDMWKDNLLALYQKNLFLETVENKGKDYMDIITQNLNPYIDSLQAKYNNVIEVDTDAFENIKLTRIDMFVIQRNAPFPVIVPSFPLLTTDNRLDYGRKSK
jgi:hypothetical protein